MLSYPNRIADRATNLAIRKLVDYLNSLGSTADQIDQECSKRHIPTMSEIQRALQQGGSNPLNLTGLQPPCPPSSSGTGFITTFSDAFSVNGNLDPSAWVQVTKPKFAPNTAPAWSERALIGNTTFDGNPGLLWSLCWDGATPAATSWRGVAFPIKNGIYTSCFNATQQFSQVDILTATSGWGQTIGPMVAFNPTDPSGITCYFIQLQTDSTGNWALRRAVSETFATLASGTGIAAGNTIRLNMDASVPGQVTLVATKNGANLTTFVDNTVNRLTQGAPGLVALVAATTGAAEMRNFSAGVGL